ncbi:type VI secretion system protein TssA [Caballeronia telluris]|uniref:ImpA domain-containing protein n=1 Tax=Caballeronia telluris TaxID=326475 RepID=A0A158IAB9_9BURK|nr:type VI secretion system protein TssA [Caballeronia telluris]SAL53081.1 ImpA domain-containing protein [Caballeronia telluris]
MKHAPIAAWLTDVAPELPCGEDEEYSTEFRALELAVAGKPDVQYGGTVVAATPPDWTRALSLSMTLLARSRDLRVAVHFTRASAIREGFEGLACGLALIEGLVDLYWETVHPQLDASDNDDPTARVNALSGLVDGAGLPAALRDVPFVVPPGQRGFALRDIEVLAGESSPAEGAGMPTLAEIEAAFAQSGTDEVEATREALCAAMASLTRIETLLTERVGPARALDFKPLAGLLARIAEFVGARVAAARETGGQRGSAMETSRNQEDADTGSATHRAAMPGPASPARIVSAQGVIEALDTICAYYADHEPSSPLPVLLQRARRLVGKSFIEIIEDVAPDGAGQFRHLGGVE